MKRRSQTQALKGSMIPKTPSRSQSMASLPNPAPTKSNASSTTTSSRRSKLLDSTNLLRTSLPEELLQEDEVDWRARVSTLEAENAKLREATSALETEIIKLRAGPAESPKLRGMEAENAKLRTQVASLSTRPTQVAYDDLKKDYDVIESILDGTQKENAHAEEQIKFLKERQRKLEDALARFIGPNWAELASIPPLSTGPASRRQSKLYGDEHIQVLPTLVETSFLSASTSSGDDVDMEPKSTSVTPTVQRLGASAMSAMSSLGGSISDQLLELYDNSSVDAAGAEAARSRQPSRASTAPLSTSMLDVSQPPGRLELEQDPVFQRMDFRVRALETIVQKFMSRAAPEHVGELSMVRDELEVEGLMGEL